MVAMLIEVSSRACDTCVGHCIDDVVFIVTSGWCFVTAFTTVCECHK